MDLKNKVFKNPKLLIKKYNDKFNPEKRSLFNDNKKNYYKMNKKKFLE